MIKRSIFHKAHSSKAWLSRGFNRLWRQLVGAVLVMAAAMLAASGAQADAVSLIIGYGENSYPAYFLEDDQWQGMDVDIINRVVARAGMAATVVSMRFPRIYQAIEAGRVHIAPNLSKNEDRSRFLDWIGPVRTTSIALITTARFRDEKITSYDDLVAVLRGSGLQIAYLSGTSFSDSLDARLAEPDFRQHLFFISENAAASRMVKAGRVLGFFYDEYEAQAAIASAREAERTGFHGLVVHDFRVPGSEAGAYIGLSKKMPLATRAALKAAFDDMKAAGELASIQCKWQALPQAKCAD